MKEIIYSNEEMADLLNHKIMVMKEQLSLFMICILVVMALFCAFVLSLNITQYEFNFNIRGFNLRKIYQKSKDRKLKERISQVLNNNYCHKYTDLYKYVNLFNTDIAHVLYINKLDSIFASKLLSQDKGDKVFWISKKLIDTNPLSSEKIYTMNTLNDEERIDLNLDKDKALSFFINKSIEDLKLNFPDLLALVIHNDKNKVNNIKLEEDFCEVYLTILDRYLKEYFIVISNKNVDLEIDIDDRLKKYKKTKLGRIESNTFKLNSFCARPIDLNEKVGKYSEDKAI